MLRGLFRTKNLDDILASIGGPQFALKRTLGAFNVTLIGVGAIIGAGIFATVGSAAAGARGSVPDNRWLYSWCRRIRDGSDGVTGIRRRAIKQARHD